MKLYNPRTDDFITDRSEIIDVLVERAARALTHTRRPDPSPLTMPPEARAVLSRALRQPELAAGPRFAVKSLVLDDWRANVIA